ncbi:MAG: glycosyltransferase [Phycisphaerales bacterium]|nr:glycosyltransferase [Phycisphaerales bacterium]
MLHVITELDLLMGGPPQALGVLARAQAAIGSDITVMPCCRSNGPQALPEGREDRLRVLAPVTNSSLKFVSPSVRRAMTAAAEGCDILHVHGSWRYHTRIAPHVARKSGAKLIIRPYGNWGIVSRAHKGYVKSMYWRLFEKRVAEAASAIHCASLKEEREIKTLNVSTRTIVVPNPIDDTLLDKAPDMEGLAAACPAVNEFEHCLLYMGRITFIKNLTALIEAFSKVAGDAPSWSLVIAGNPEDAELARRLRRMTVDLGLERRVVIPGMLVGGVKVAALRRADLFVQPSLHENFGVSTAEALLFGVPCVASDGVALATDIEAAKAGLECSTQSDSIAAALRTLMLDAEMRKTMAANAGELANRFRPRAVALAMDAEYRRC